MEQLLSELMKVGPVALILGLALYRVYRMYLSEKAARIKLEKEWRDYLKEEVQDSRSIIQEDTKMKATMLKILERQKQQKGT